VTDEQSWGNRPIGRLPHQAMECGVSCLSAVTAYDAVPIVQGGPSPHMAPELIDDQSALSANKSRGDLRTGQSAPFWSRSHSARQSTYRARFVAEPSFPDGDARRLRVKCLPTGEAHAIQREWGAWIESGRHRDEPPGVQGSGGDTRRPHSHLGLYV
jgi:hypothetical protein